MERTSVQAENKQGRISLASTSGVLQRQCACGNHTMAGGKCADCAKNKSGLQRKLAIGASHDPLEREADRVADQVMAATANPTVNSAPPRIQRFTGQATGDNGTAPASVDRVLANGGRPLDPALQQDMGQRFGRDFSQVRVHTGGAAEQSARDVRANATGADSSGLPGALREMMESQLGASFGSVRVYASGKRSRDVGASGAMAMTRGNEVTFAPSMYRPDMLAGRALIAHELTHVVQQRRSSWRDPSAAEQLESEAQRVEHSVRDSREPSSVTGASRETEQHAGWQEMAAAIAAAASGGLLGLADFIVSTLGKDDPLIQRIATVRDKLKTHVGHIVLSSSVVRRMQAMYDQVKASVPSWVPLPDFQFVAEAQPAVPFIIAGVVITVEAMILFFAMMIVMVWLLGNLDPATKHARDQAVKDLLDGIEDLLKQRETKPKQPETKPEQPETKPEQPKTKPEQPKTDDPPPVSPFERCPYPTGLTMLDPISMVWFKPRIDNYYPKTLEIGDQVYGRDDPSNPRKLPLGEPLGVPNKFWPRLGKIMQLTKVERDSAAADFRAVLERYGFDWAGLQADHVQDVDWDGPDEFKNLWPMSEDANASAGPRQNQHQRVSYCETPVGPKYEQQRLSEFKALPGRYGRFFRIGDVER